MKKKVLGILTLCTLITYTNAQSLIVGIPNGEVTKEGIILIATESQINTWTSEQITNTNFFFSTYGIGFNTEICLTLFNFNIPVSTSRTVAIGFKNSQKLFQEQFPEINGAFTFGQMIPYSLDGKGVGSWTYFNISGRLPFSKTRITLGPSYGTRQIFGTNSLSFMLGYEQPIFGHFSLIGDWYSGSHELSAFIFAGQYDIYFSDHQRLTLIGGYKLPNSARSGPQTVMLEVTFEF